MKKKYLHTEAAHLLVKHSLPTEEEIDAMDPTQLAAFLSSQGVDVGKFQGEISELQSQLTGKLTFAHAKKQRLAKSNSLAEADLSHMTQRDFESALLSNFGSFEAMPLAARNHKTMNREDWESLYRDLILTKGQ